MERLQSQLAAYSRIQADPQFILWGLVVSPYQLKMQSLLDASGFSWQRWPDQGGRFAAMRMALRLQLALKMRKVSRFPTMHGALDEYPAVPFFTEDGRFFQYDSSSLALYLDQHPQRSGPSPLPDDPALNFVCRLIDEAFDEFGLYMVHHQRWVTSAASNVMGELTAHEMRHIFPFGLGKRLTKQLPRRQVRRCPYLFSVAAKGFDCGMPAELTPPHRAGFPSTHALLDSAWCDSLSCLESLLQHQPYLLGAGFTLADASVYGQLSMNLVDGIAGERIRELAPSTHAWLCAIRNAEHVKAQGELQLSSRLLPLMKLLGETFVPLMQQNEAAYQHAIDRGQTLFNEAAFDQGLALYDGRLRGHAYRAVIKSFQVVVWRQLQEHWQSLPETPRQQLRSWLPLSITSALS